RGRRRIRGAAGQQRGGGEGEKGGAEHGRASVVGGRQFAAAGGGRGDGAANEFAEAAGLEGLDRGLGRAAGGGHAPAQLGRVGIRFGQHARGAEDGLQHQRARGVLRETLFAGRGLHRLGQQEHVGRTAAGRGGHRVHP